jgi:prepilin-type N-terminal cleavage/methylation domain-containing protein
MNSSINTPPVDNFIGFCGVSGKGEGWYNGGAMVGKFFAKIHNHKNRVQSGGFTLIELLVVVAIIALLSEIVLASLQTATAKARNAKRVEMVKQYQNALELYYTDSGIGVSARKVLSVYSLSHVHREESVR